MSEKGAYGGQGSKKRLESWEGLPDMQETSFLRAFVMNKRSAARRLTGPCNGVVFHDTICLSQQFAFFYNGGGFFG